MGTWVIVLLVTLGEVYPAVGLRTHPVLSLPAPDVVAAILQPPSRSSMVSIAVMLLVYPVEPRWRPVLCG